jgi:hypothetical protein
MGCGDAFSACSTAEAPIWRVISKLIGFVKRAESTELDFGVHQISLALLAAGNLFQQKLFSEFSNSIQE